MSIQANKPNITYLLGAGASYKAMPIVSEMKQAIHEIQQIIGTVYHKMKKRPNENKGSFHMIEIFYNHLAQLIDISEDYKTIDTYARKLVLTQNEDELHKLKATLSIIFELWQSWKYRSKFLGPGIESTNVSAEKEFIDSRYTTLFSNLLNLSDNKLSLPPNIKFLTWNYDTQIERSLNLFLEEKEFNNVFNHFKIYPQIKNYYYEPNPQIVHLNGIAGTFLTDKENHASIINRFEPNAEIDTAILKLTKCYEWLEKGEASFNSKFNFAWEDTKFANEARERAIGIMSKTHILVVIGYSFPSFNLNVDRKLFEAFKSGSKSKAIYYQDLTPNKSIISESFGFDSSRIVTIESTDQFFLPRQFL